MLQKIESVKSEYIKKLNLIFSLLFFLGACAHTDQQKSDEVSLKTNSYYIVPTSPSGLKGAFTEVKNITILKERNTLELSFLSPAELSGKYQMQVTFSGKLDKDGFYNLSAKNIGHARCFQKQTKMVCIINYQSFAVDRKSIESSIKKQYQNSPSQAQAYTTAMIEFHNEPGGILVVDLNEAQTPQD